MARNVEIKARLDSIEALLPTAAALADHGPEHIAQDDTFFGCLHGRLKLRLFAEDEQQGNAEAHDLLARLNVQPSQLVGGAYLDLLLEQSDLPPTGRT